MYSEVKNNKHKACIETLTINQEIENAKKQNTLKNNNPCINYNYYKN